MFTHVSLVSHAAMKFRSCCAKSSPPTLSNPPIPHPSQGSWSPFPHHHSMPSPPTEGGKEGESPLKAKEKRSERKVVLAKEEPKQSRISDFTEFRMEETFKVYTTAIGKEARATTKAPAPIRDKLLEIVTLFERAEFQYTHYPTYQDGGVVMEPVGETSTRAISECAEKILRREQGMDKEMALHISKALSTSHPEERTKARIATVIGDSTYVFDWVLAKDPWTKAKQQILTWVPIDTKSPQRDNHSRKKVARLQNSREGDIQDESAVASDIPLLGGSKEERPGQIGHTIQDNERQLHDSPALGT